MKNLRFAGRRIGARSMLSPPPPYQHYIVVSHVTPILTPRTSPAHPSLTPAILKNFNMYVCSLCAANLRLGLSVLLGYSEL